MTPPTPSCPRRGRQEVHLVELYRAGGRTIAELEELFGVTRSTVYRHPACRDHHDLAGPFQRVNAHLFVDEAIRSAITSLLPLPSPWGTPVSVRARMRGLTLLGQHRLHMKKESDLRKRAVAAAICRTGVRATIYQAGRRVGRGVVVCWAGSDYSPTNNTARRAQKYQLL